MDDFLESRAWRLMAGYVVCYVVGSAALIVAMMANEPFAVRAFWLMDHHATALAIASFVALPVFGAIVIAIIILAITIFVASA